MKAFNGASIFGAISILLVGGGMAITAVASTTTVPIEELTLLSESAPGAVDENADRLDQPHRPYHSYHRPYYRPYHSYHRPYHSYYRPYYSYYRPYYSYYRPYYGAN